MNATTEDVPERSLIAFGLNDTANVLRRPHFREAARLAEVRLAGLLTQARFFDGAPSSWVLVSAGLYRESQTPRLGRIDKKYGDLDISIAIDGISLTLVTVVPGAISVMLIPHTLAHTTLGLKAVGDEVNLEFDLLAKHVKKLLTHLTITL